MKPTTEELIKDYISSSKINNGWDSQDIKGRLQGRLDVYEELYGSIINLIEEEDYDERVVKTDRIFTKAIAKIKAVLS